MTAPNEILDPPLISAEVSAFSDAIFPFSYYIYQRDWYDINLAISRFRDHSHLRYFPYVWYILTYLNLKEASIRYVLWSLFETDWMSWSVSIANILMSSTNVCDALWDIGIITSSIQRVQGRSSTNIFKIRVFFRMFDSEMMSSDVPR